MREQSEQRLDLQLGCMFEPYLKQPTKLAGPKAPPAHHHAPSFLFFPRFGRGLGAFASARPSAAVAQLAMQRPQPSCAGAS
jgi:hypothetical protein